MSNPAKCRSYQLAYESRLAPEDLRAQRRAKLARWRAAHPEKRKAIRRSRKALERGSEGRHTDADIEFLKTKQRGRCAHPWCRSSLKGGHHVDHIIPLALKGRNDRGNLQLLCEPCNLAKGAQHPVSFALAHGMLV